MIKYILPMILALLSIAWTQNIFTYINTNARKPIIDFMEILSQSGLINAEKIEKDSTIQRNFFEPIELAEHQKDIVTTHKTLASKSNSQIEIFVETKNYFLAKPHYISPGIIYNKDLSKETQGRFVFFIQNTGGPISIRIFSPEGDLKREEIWHIEAI